MAFLYLEKVLQILALDGGALVALGALAGIVEHAHHLFIKSFENLGRSFALLGFNIGFYF